MDQFQLFQITMKAARINRGMTLKEVAEATGKHAETISKYEADSTDIPRDLMIKLLEIYRVSDDLIFFGKESSFHGLMAGKTGDQNFVGSSL